MIGAPELMQMWQDPDFDPGLRAFYYVRVLEIPTPRWTAYDAKRFNVKMDQTDFNATVETEADSPERAMQRTQSYNWLLAGGEVNARLKNKEEEVIFKNTKVTAEGKQIVVRFKMPRHTAGEMLKKQIEPKPAS